VILRMEEPGVETVAVRVTVTDLTTRSRIASVALGWVHTRRTLTVKWPSGAVLSAGSYQVTVTAHDHHGGALLRLAHSSGVATLTVSAVVAPPPSAPKPLPRGSHTHQGQDVLSAEGTPIVAPMAGTISWTSYQAGGAGYYAVEHTTVGFDFMFAHCQAGSLAVSREQAVSAGQQLCSAGQTGDATTPHLHFEMWVGGWAASTGHPIDPLPYLEAWDHTGASAS
jgi:murein DD-endopeptidase MepM/ murein hydrolase activator NlpD